jgi:hypothetical protein
LSNVPAFTAAPADWRVAIDTICPCAFVVVMLKEPSALVIVVVVSPDAEADPLLAPPPPSEEPRAAFAEESDGRWLGARLAPI